MDFFNLGIRLMVLLLLTYKHTSGKTTPTLDPTDSENIIFQQHPHVVRYSSEETFLSDQHKSAQDNAKYNSNSGDIIKNSQGIDDGQMNTLYVGPDRFYYFTSKNSQKSILGEQLDFTRFADILKTISDKDQEKLEIYRISKLNHLVLPLRATLSVEIKVYNPFQKTLKVIEVFGGGPKFQLILPSGKLEDKKSIWNIMPYQTKPIIKFIFSGSTKNNHTTNVGIILSNRHYLNIPINILMLPKPGIYNPELIIDFGFIFKNSILPTRTLKLCNSAKSSNTIKNITSDSQFVVVNFTKEVEISPQSCTTGHVALITHCWNYTRYSRGQIYGQLTVKSVKGSELYIPYNANLVLGNLAYEEKSLHFVIPKDSYSTSFVKTFSIKNNFVHISVAISEVILPKNATQYFMIKGFHPVVIKPNQSVPLFQIVCFDISNFQTEWVSSLELKTNASDLAIPLMAYEGLLIDIVPDRYIIKFSSNTTIPCHTYLVVANKNPVSLKLENWGTMYMPYVTLFLVEMDKYNSSIHKQVNEWSRPKIKRNLAKPPIMLPPKHYAIFQLTVHQEANQKQKVDVDVWIQTPYQRYSKLLMLPEFKEELLVMEEPLEFKNCHPGSICIVDVNIKSWLNEIVLLNSVTDDVSTENIVFLFSNTATIQPQAVSLVGQIQWIPVSRKSSENYIGLTKNEKAMWLSSLQLKKSFDASKKDFSWFYHRLEKFYSKVIHQSFKHNFILQSIATHKCHFTVFFYLKWPVFVQNELKYTSTDDSRHQTTYELPITEVNGIPQYQKIVVKNTFKSRNLTIQFAMYAKPYWCNITDFVNLHDHEVHTLNVSRDDWELMLNNTSPYRREVLNIKNNKYDVHNQTMLFVLPPQEQLEVLVRFWPKKQGDSRAVLFIRNDASVLEIVSFKGKGVHPVLLLQSDDKPIRVIFDLGSKSLIERLCNKHKYYKSPNLTETKAFILVNPYSKFVIVSAMKINGVPCEVDGIRIFNCKKFILFPKEIREMSIELYIDFTLKNINFELEILTLGQTGGPENTDRFYKYELFSIIPLDWENCQHNVFTSIEFLRDHGDQEPNWLYQLGLTIVLTSIIAVVSVPFIKKF